MAHARLGKIRGLVRFESSAR